MEGVLLPYEKVKKESRMLYRFERKCHDLLLQYKKIHG